ncbi:MAG: hypothetical protein IJH84_21695 [Saccharopolyspora sp.]|uniref:hypothetical protein n=1 Tax=Saccharopolyspora TaxID=1835 RepID=UPI00190C0457|nr:MULTISPECIES: hypothetical protein [unclassified Saccharopolyspora]MBK0865991.1 hypothetical protein [Saccharopolyspora sp. HNM0986]MBQ6643628.1 hypothetical protein [Saccharopolyspora sp.]
MRPLLIIGSLLGVLAVAGCGQPPPGGGEPASVTVPPHVPVATTPATSAGQPTPSTAEQQESPESSAASSPAPTATPVPGTTSETPGDPGGDDPGGDLACGDVTNKAGASYSLFSRRGADGSYAGCTEAINVMSAYMNLPADEYDGSSRSATVQGYRCQVLPSGERMKTACDNPSKGMSIYTTG